MRVLIFVLSLVCRPSIHDNFIALSGHASNLMKQLRNEKTPPLQNLVVLPLEIRNEPDRYLEVRDMFRT